MEIVSSDMGFSVKSNISDSMPDKEFFDFCQQTELLRIERDENKQIIIKPITKMPIY